MLQSNFAFASPGSGLLASEEVDAMFELADNYQNWFEMNYFVNE